MLSLLLLVLLVFFHLSSEWLVKSRNYFSLKPSSFQGQSSHKISAHLGSPFRRSQGTNKQTNKQSNRLNDRLVLLQRDYSMKLCSFYPLRESISKHLTSRNCPKNQVHIHHTPDILMPPEAYFTPKFTYDIGFKK